jgi:hypothetical protein
VKRRTFLRGFLRSRMHAGRKIPAVEHPSASVSIRQHTSAYVSIRLLEVEKSQAGKKERGGGGCGEGGVVEEMTKKYQGPEIELILRFCSAYSFLGDSEDIRGSQTNYQTQVITHKSTHTPRRRSP